MSQYFLDHHEKLAYLSLRFGGQENVVVQTEDQCGLACFLNNGSVDSFGATMYLLLMPYVLAFMAGQVYSLFLVGAV